MSEAGRRPRADAARNRAKVLDAAIALIATEGASVPIDDIARHAGVGAGTVYRHFPAKSDLLAAVLDQRFTAIISQGRALLDGPAPGEALFVFVSEMVLRGGATDRGLAEALASSGIDLMPSEDGFGALLDDVLDAARREGTVREDLTGSDLKALLVGCQAMQAYDSDAAIRGVQVVLDGLRSRAR